jgi:hypothetical protein
MCQLVTTKKPKFSGNLFTQNSAFLPLFYNKFMCKFDQNLNYGSQLKTQTSVPICNIAQVLLHSKSVCPQAISPDFPTAVDTLLFTDRFTPTVEITQPSSHPGTFPLGYENQNLKMANLFVPRSMLKMYGSLLLLLYQCWWCWLQYGITLPSVSYFNISRSSCSIRGNRQIFVNCKSSWNEVAFRTNWIMK